MHASGKVSIHSHSRNHYVLSECSRELSFIGIKENKAFIETILGAENTHFALPFGKEAHYDLRILEQCRDLAYKYVYTTNPNSFNLTEMGSADIKVIPRISITNQSIHSMMFMVNMGIFKKHSLWA